MLDLAALAEPLVVDTTVPPLHLDIESRSTEDLRKCGVHVYAEHPNTDVWCVCYAIGDDPVQVWLPGQPVPPAIVAHVKARGVIWAHNAAFERLIWQHILAPRYGWPLVAFEQWGCTMARAFAAALPGGLEKASAALGLASKDADGYRLMLTMAKPRRVKDGSLVWWNEPARLKKLIAYCKQDVVVERALHGRLPVLSATELEIWRLDQTINDRGLKIDSELCLLARRLVDAAIDDLNKEIVKLTNNEVLTGSSVKQIVRFCIANGMHARDTKGDEKVLTTIAADAVEELLARTDLPPTVRRVLEIRQEVSKVSVKKIDALLTGCSEDGRVKGLLQYHAAHSGRWGGRRVQPQNFKRPTIDADQDTLIKLIRTGSLETIAMIGGPCLTVVGEILRGLIVADEGKLLFAADYTAIEARALAWLVSEDWKVQAFRAFDAGTGPDMYRLAYSKAFNVSLEQVDKSARQIGKTIELACGYQGSVGAFQTMAYTLGVKVSDEEALRLVRAWRKIHPQTVKFWAAIERVAIKTVRLARGPKLDPTTEEAKADAVAEFMVWDSGISFSMHNLFLRMHLPSGRMLHYPNAKVAEVKTRWLDPNGEDVYKDSVTFMSALNPSNVRRLVPNHEDNESGWGRISTYGGCLTENAVQAIARDVMAAAMLRLEGKNWPVLLTVHDEIVCEAPAGRSVVDFEKLMEIVPGWAPSFPLAAEAWHGTRYRKN